MYINSIYNKTLYIICQKSNNNNMTTYAFLTVIHVSFTLFAAVVGLIAIFSTPTGNKLHRRSGLLYFYAYIALYLVALVMLFFKFKTFLFLSTFIFFYLIFMGYRSVKYKTSKAKFIDWLMLVLLFLSGVGLVFYSMRLLDAERLGWLIITYFYVLLILYVVITDVLHFSSIKNNKKVWLSRHMEKMLISYIALVGGISLRIFPMPQAYFWVMWIAPYIVLLPLVFLWVSKYKKGKKKTDLATFVVREAQI